MSTVILVENLSKAYQLGQIGTGTLTNDLKLWWAKARGKPNPLLRIGESDHGNRSGETIWALKDVSFEVQQGEALGVIGRNGAGKSTLLKVLSRITAPTSGRVRVKGRIASLLEVGTGFHPELTGRENIYLNGAILGMRRDEVRRKFDEIVDFAGIAQFVDTPVKRYSSGMYVRLAFAVAAHLEPEILLVDEVLAVGDAEFQKKCLGKMGEVASEGRTVLFVSHNMAAVQKLCPRSLLINKGELAVNERTEFVIQNYLVNRENTQHHELSDFRAKWAKPYINNIELKNSKGLTTNIFMLGEQITFIVQFSCPEEAQTITPVLGIVINHHTRGSVGGVNMRMTGFEYPIKKFNHGTIECVLKDTPLIQGSYQVDIWLGDEYKDLDLIQGFLHFTVEERDLYGTGKAPFSHIGVIFLSPTWNIIDYA